MFKRILVPLDGSEVAEGVLPFVKAEASAHGATVVIMRVVAPFRSTLMMSPALLEQASAQILPMIESYLEETAAGLRDEGFTVETVLKHGPPAERIIQYAESEGVDLIVIASRGETGTPRWRFGAIANKIVKTKTSMPVMVVTT
jgi:nucleotide-binding universal stress UspA family protein